MQFVINVAAASEIPEHNHVACHFFYVMAQL